LTVLTQDSDQAVIRLTN